MDKEKQARNEQAAKLAEQKHDAREQPEKTAQAAFPAEKSTEELEQEFAGLAERLLRLTAEFENYKKRTAKEKEALCLHSEAKVMLRLLPIYEEIGLAEQEVAKLPEGEARKGTLMVLAKMRKSFEGDGLVPMKLDGEKLDPFRHEVALREDSSAPEGTIVRVIKQGYLYKGEVLQHAIVSVSSGKMAGEENADASASGEKKGKSNNEVGE